MIRNLGNIKINSRTLIHRDINIDINKAIINAIISLGHSINIEITAEGVETKEQYDYLEKQGCNSCLEIK